MPYQPHTVRDGVAFASAPGPLRACAAGVMARMQDHAPQYQLLGTAVALAAMAESIGLNPHAVLSRARNALRDLEAAHTHQVQAVRDYARGELLRA